ncbi:DinB family protein [Tunicatimonas pelagia]|uniref:DinB family protein n=1 Tax=Tunicatimonas pelagia TaxID=931531 RepID=UPI0026668F7F|nr:DinB family protein [Tunicatimonas pelagia]WKN42375.1 DinB family protein [Tunicatimonas pelagia]
MNNKEIYKNAPKYCDYFFDLIESDNLLAEFEKSKELTLDILKLVPPDLENYSYQTDKWTIKEVLRHIIDMERIFAYRAFRFSRLDDTDLSGVEENDYINNAKQNEIKLSELRNEYLAVRNSTVWVYKNLSTEMLNFKGTANAQTYTAETLGFAMIGHNVHHVKFIEKTYLNKK